jgi:hypothetical protein
LNNKFDLSLQREGARADEAVANVVKILLVFTDSCIRTIKKKKENGVFDSSSSSKRHRRVGVSRLCSLQWTKELFFHKTNATATFY